MAITHVASSSGSSATSGSVNVTKPIGTASGDVLLVFGSSNEGAWNTLPSGFTQIAVSTDADTPNNFRTYAWYKVCGGSEPSSYTFGSTTASGAGAPMAVSMTCWRGVHATSPINTSSHTSGGNASEPANPTISVTSTQPGRLIFSRSARSTTALPVFSTTNIHWTIDNQVADFSGTSVRYGVSQWAYKEDLAPLTLNEPGISCSTDETDNVYMYVVLRAAPEGTAAATLPSVTSEFAGDHRISGTASVTLASVAFTAAGMGAPPEGTVDTALAPITVQFDGGSVGGAMSTTLAPVEALAEASVNPIGGFAGQLAPVTSDFLGETRSFGEHVIRVEAEHRAFRVIDDDTGLVAIKRSQVTDA